MIRSKAKKERKPQRSQRNTEKKEKGKGKGRGNLLWAAFSGLAYFLPSPRLSSVTSVSSVASVASVAKTPAQPGSGSLIILWLTVAGVWIRIAIETHIHGSLICERCR